MYTYIIIKNPIFTFTDTKSKVKSKTRDRCSFALLTNASEIEDICEPVVIILLLSFSAAASTAGASRDRRNDKHSWPA